MNELLPDKPPVIHTNSIHYLITQGLGYCCIHRFMHLFDAKSTNLIADRLGCTPRAVRNHRRAYRQGTSQPCVTCLRRD